MPRDFTGRLHALLRVWLPTWFRVAHAADMERAFRDRLKDEARRGSRWRITAAWMREAWDLADTGVRLRTSNPTGGGGDMGGWIDDLRSALRSLWRSPGFAAFAVGTLALGIGATITFASFLDRIVLRPVDFPGGDRLVTAWRWQAAGRFMISPDLATRDRVRQADVFDGVAATGRHDVAWSTDDGSRVLSAIFMDEALPALAGLSPLVGRFFEAQDLAGAGAPVVLLSEGLWKRAFGADPEVVGQALRVDGEPRTVIGVTPDALRPPGPEDRDVDLWLPLPADGSEAGVDVFARLRDGVTLEQARERMKSLDLAAAESEKSEWETRLVPAGEMSTKQLRNPLKVAGAAVALLMLIACLNVASLLLARGDARARDTAVRAAVGAGRLRLARETLLESCLIAFVASVMGLGLAAGAVETVRKVHPRDLAVLATLHLDPMVTALAVAGGVVTVLLFGALPLAHRIRTKPGAVLTERSGTADSGSVSARRLLLVGEVALSFALLAGGVQVVSTLAEIRSRDPGLAIDELLTVQLRRPEWRFVDDAEWEAALEEIRAGVLRLPGVGDAAIASRTPPHPGVYVGTAEAEGREALGDGAARAVFFGGAVSPGYFGVAGQSMVRGRGFTANDVLAEPAPYILGESAARKYFPDADAVGGRFRLDAGDWHTVVGIVRDTWATGEANGPEYPQLYTVREPGVGSSLLVRSDDPAAVAAEIRGVVQSVDVEIPVLNVLPMAGMYREALARQRLIALLLAAFAITAAFLAAVGLYGVVAQIAVRRTREFGIRISLGAEPPSIFGLAMRGGVASVGVGLAMGAGLSWAGLRFLKMGVAGLGEADPLAFFGAALLLSMATFFAMGVPAARAARIDPTEALRAQ